MRIKAFAHTFTPQGFKWRLEAWRTGKSFAEIVMRHTLVYRVEQVFLICNDVLLLHAKADAAITTDPDMVGGMLSVIQTFVSNRFQTDISGLEEFRSGDSQIWIENGRRASLAAYIRGNPPRELRTTLKETIEHIHALKGTALANFCVDGETSPFESLRPELEACLVSQYR